MTPRLIVSAPRSGEGKTTVALGLMAAFCRRGLNVQGFKVGPDYLDTTHQALATGHPGRNLDLWLMGDHGVAETFARASHNADLAIVEGAMGLFDGHRDGVTPTSTADIAKRLKAPVLLVLDASHQGASVAALALGFREFDRDVEIAGVILNRWRPQRDKRAVEQAFARINIPILGFLEPHEKLTLPSRHLGVLGAPEMGDEARRVVTSVAEALEKSLDLDRIFKLAQRTITPPEKTAFTATSAPLTSYLRIGIARDEAFFFYYPENLEALEALGATLVEVSPLRDAALPPHLDGLYLGGGYPEVHASTLSGNTSFLESLRSAAQRGLPIYAECGGLMYLTRSLTLLEGERWPLVGLVPGDAQMHPRLQGMGYREMTLPQSGFPGEAHDAIRGHEFHYSSITYDDDNPGAYLNGERSEGFASGNIFASYLHVHFSGHPNLPLRFVQAAAKYQTTQLPGPYGPLKETP